MSLIAIRNCKKKLKNLHPELFSLGNPVLYRLVKYVLSPSQDANEAGSEAGVSGASASSSQDSILSSKGATAVAGAVGGASHHDRTLPNVLTRIRNILDNRGSVSRVILFL